MAYFESIFHSCLGANISAVSMLTDNKKKVMNAISRILVFFLLMMPSTLIIFVYNNSIIAY